MPWISAARKADRATASGALEEHRAWIFHLALGIVGSRDLADDVLQEVMVKAIRHLPTLRDPDAASAWLRKTAVRQCLNELRKRRHPTDLASGRDEPDPDLHLAVSQTLDRLSPDHRAVLALAIGEGLSYEEIADSLALPVGTVGSRIHLAKAAFRKAWEEQ